MKSRNLKERGVTLLSLVITIIILIILAGVTINLAIRRKWINPKNRNVSRKE